jgi:serine/threonine protein kinase
MPNPTLGRYELLRRLSGGGMGEVHLARRIGDAPRPGSGPGGDAEPLYVVKTLLPHLLRDRQMAVMFADEARIAARLVHPHICRVFELGQDGSACFIAMEYVAGLDLFALQKACASRGLELPAHLACRIVADAAAGLHFAHSLCDTGRRPYGIVHRDVSPQNVLVGFDGCVKVIDFGVAKARGRAQRTEAGALKGKFAYMSPEQASSGGVDRRSDVFALGIVLHELVTGERLFKAATDAATLARVRACEVEPPAGIDRELQAIILRALRRDPRERFQTADELRLALEGWLSRTNARSSRDDLASFLREVRSESPDADVPSGNSLGIAAGSGMSPHENASRRFRKAREASASVSRVLTRAPASAKWMTAATLSVGALAIAIVLRPPANAGASPAATAASLLPASPASTVVVPEVSLVRPNTHPVVIATTPSGASIYEGQTLIGKSPAAWSAPEGKHELRVAGAGYPEALRSIDVERDGQRFTLELRPTASR